MIGWILGIVGGLAIGIGLAFLITMNLVKKSNDMGDSSATMEDVSKKGLEVISRRDNLHSAK